MPRFYQNVLTGEKVEVKSLDEDDFYLENAANWSRIEQPPVAPKPEPVKDPVAKPAPKQKG